MKASRGPGTAPAHVSAYARALEHRFPGVTVQIAWIDHSYGDPDLGCTLYAGWRLEFTASDPQLLIDYALASPAEFANGGRPDEFGHVRSVARPLRSRGRWQVLLHVPDVIPPGHDTERRAHSKKMQRTVSALLKRAFARPRRESSG